MLKSQVYVFVFILMYEKMQSKLSELLPFHLSSNIVIIQVTFLFCPF